MIGLGSILGLRLGLGKGLDIGSEIRVGSVFELHFASVLECTGISEICT